jgi:tetratricopeptide (TPR) repeat protein
MTRLVAPLLIVLAALIGLSFHTVVNCGDADEPDICSAVIGFSPLRGSVVAFAYEGRARVAMRKGNYGRAIADFDQAIALNPNRASAFRGRGDAYRQTGEFDSAIADYDQAIALNPRLAAPYLDRGVALAAKGDLDRAILSFNTALRLAPADPGAHANRGLSLLAQGRGQEAKSDFEAVLALPGKQDGWARRVARTKLNELASAGATQTVAPTQ